MMSYLLGIPISIATPQHPEMLYDERAIVTALTITIDFDYFSESGG
jgi:hypothetical protein